MNKYVGLGALLGGFSQDPFEDPFTSIAGASVGGIIGNYLSQDLNKEVNRFKEKSMVQSMTRMDLKPQVRDRATLMRELLDDRDLKILSMNPENSKKFFTKIYEAFGLSTSNFDSLQFDKNTNLSLMKSLQSQTFAIDEAKIRALIRDTNGLVNNLQESTLSQGLPELQLRDSTMSFKNQNEAYKEAFIKSGFSEGEAALRAQRLAAATQGHSVSLEYTKSGIPRNIKFNDLKITLPVTQAVDIGDRRVFSAGLDGLTVNDLRNGKANPIVRKINPYAGLVGKDGSGEIKQYDVVDGKYSNPKYLKVDGNLLNQGYLPEDLIGAMGTHQGRPLTAPELLETIRKGNSTRQYNATASLYMAQQASDVILLGDTLRAPTARAAKDGYKWAQASREQITEAIRLVQRVTNRSPVRGVSGNNIKQISTGQGYTQWLPVPAIENNAEYTNVREYKPLYNEKLIKMYDGTSMAHRYEHGNNMKSISVSNNLADYFAQKFGPEFSIDDGSGIVINHANKQSLANFREDVAVLGVFEENGTYKIQSRFGSLLTDDFFKLDPSERIAQIKAAGLQSISRGEVIGEGQHKTIERLGAQYDRAEITDIVKTERGVEVKFKSISEPTDWVKLFSLEHKTGNSIIDGSTRSAQGMQMLAALEAAGEISVGKDGLYVGPDRKKVELGTLMDDARFEGLRQKYAEQALSIQHISSYTESKKEVLQGILGGDKNALNSWLKRTQSSDLMNDEFTKNLINTVADQSANKFERANAARYVDMIRTDNKFSAGIFHDIATRIYENKGINIVDSLRAEAEALVKGDADRRKQAHQYLFSQLKAAYGNNSLSQNIQNIFVTAETGVESHGSGNLSSASHLQIATMKASGWTDDMLDNMFKSDVNPFIDINLARSQFQEGLLDISNLNKDQLGQLNQVFAQAPEQRAGFLRRMGFAVPEGALFTSISLSGDSQIKSVPISFVSSNRTGMTAYNPEIQEVLTSFERSRQNLLGAELTFRASQIGSSTIDESLKKNITSAAQDLEKVTGDSFMRLLKESSKRKAVVGNISTVISYGGEDVRRINKNLGPTAFIGTEHKWALDAQLRQFGSHLEYADVIGENGKVSDRYKKLVQVMEDGSRQDFLYQYTREPAQGPHSSMIMNTVVDLQSARGNQYVGIAGGDKFLGVLSKLDYDADSPAFAGIVGMNKEQYSRIKSIQKMQRDTGDALLKSYDPKNPNDPGFAAMLDPKRRAKEGAFRTLLDDGLSGEIQDVLSMSHAKAAERKYSAGLATTLNQNMQRSLIGASGSDIEIARASNLIYGVTEATLKTSHKDLGQYTIDQDKAIKNLTEISSLAGKGEIGESEFKNRFKTNLNNLLSINDSHLTGDFGKDYISAQNLVADRYFNYLKDGGKHPTLGQNVDMRDLGGSINRLAEDYLKDSIGPSKASGITITTELNRIKSAAAAPKEALNSVKNIFKKNKTPLLIGGAALAGLALFNAADTTELPANRTPMPSKPSAPQPLEPRSIATGHTRTLREKNPYDVKITGSTKNSSNIRKFVQGDGREVRKVDVNYKTRQG